MENIIIDGVVFYKTNEHPLFFISKCAKVYRISYTSKRRSLEGRYLKQSKDKFGYVKVSFCYDNKVEMHLVHRLVAKTFIPNPENKPQVNHINNIPYDNRVENLEWCTSKENIHHSIKQGRNAKGLTHPRAKITPETAKMIIEKLEEGIRPYKLAKSIGVSVNIVMDIHKKNAWNWLR